MVKAQSSIKKYSKTVLNQTAKILMENAKGKLFVETFSTSFSQEWQRLSIFGRKKHFGKTNSSDASRICRRCYFLVKQKGSVRFAENVCAEKSAEPFQFADSRFAKILTFLYYQHRSVESRFAEMSF